MTLTHGNHDVMKALLVALGGAGNKEKPTSANLQGVEIANMKERTVAQIKGKVWKC